MNKVRVYIDGDAPKYRAEWWTEEQARDLGYRYDVRFGGWIRHWRVEDTYSPILLNSLMGDDDPIYQVCRRVYKMFDFFTTTFKIVISWRNHRHYLVDLYRRKDWVI